MRTLWFGKEQHLGGALSTPAKSKGQAQLQDETRQLSYTNSLVVAKRKM